MVVDYTRKLETPVLELRLGFLLLPDFTLLALTGFIEALRIAGDEFDLSRNLYCRWDIMAPDSRQIRSSCGLTVLPTARLQPPENFDYIVVVGGKLQSHERTDPAITDYLRDAAGGTVPMIGACTGSFMLARTGALQGRRACVHQFHTAEFQAEFPDIMVESDRLFTIDGPRLTCPGGASAFDLAIHLIQRHCGRERALKTVSLLLFDEARASNHPQARTALDLSAPVRDPFVRRALLLMQQNLGSPVTIQSIAETLGTNMRKLTRAFHAQLDMSPAHTYRQIRLERALWLIGHTGKSMSEIAYECGFSDASHFSRMFKEVFDTSPSDVRAQLRAQATGPRAVAGSFMSELSPA
ncbi:GlxA family transcriptional regulator [Novosphingobium resinovorum]|uniref:GlxA family transcriptional regulator n=1 Tax=Novosphingobium resinovorum TaxID=158500 RepID=UPI002ED53E1F